MAAEIRAAADVLAAQAVRVGAMLPAVVAAIRSIACRHAVTIARGSSDHAAGYLGYLLMQHGLWATSLPLSIVTLHRAVPRCEGMAAIALSQSGRSPDLVAALETLGRSGALTIAMVNDEGSPLAAAASHLLPLGAGREASVAATKSCVAQFALSARLVAAVSSDRALTVALDGLPERVSQAVAVRGWDECDHAFATVDRLCVLGRGLGLAVAREVALKLKEVCGIQAEAFSSAEWRHGPMSLLAAGYPVLIMATGGREEGELLRLAAELRTLGAEVRLVGRAGQAGVDWSCIAANDARLDPVCMLVQAYRWVEAMARRRGRDPDRPPYLSKVTETL